MSLWSCELRCVGSPEGTSYRMLELGCGELWHSVSSWVQMVTSDLVYGFTEVPGSSVPWACVIWASYWGSNGGLTGELR